MATPRNSSETVPIEGASFPQGRTFRDLAAKGAQAQWSAADAVNWTDDIALPAWLPRKFYAAILSQIYYGERAASRMCQRILDDIRDPLARHCMELQLIDEERHAEVYLAYLEGIGGLEPIEPLLAAAYEEALSWSGPPLAMVAAFNIVLDGEALYILDDLGSWLPCPRFRRINAPIRRDEARHLAFGKLYLKSTAGALSPEQRLDIYRWLKGLWHDTAFGLLDRAWIPSSMLRRRYHTWAETGWRGHRLALIGAGLVDPEDARFAEGLSRRGGGG